MKKKRKLKKKSIIGLILIMITFTSSFLLAKFTSNAAGNNSSRVGKWIVECTNCDTTNPKEVSLIAGNDTLTQEYTLTVKNISEVSASYKVVLTNVPGTMQVKIDNGNYQTPSNNTITFTDGIYIINASDNTKIKTHTLTFKIPIDLDFTATNNIDVDVVFNQID